MSFSPGIFRGDKCLTRLKYRSSFVRISRRSQASNARFLIVKASSKSGVAAIFDNIRSRTEPKSCLNPIEGSVFRRVCVSKRLVRGRRADNLGVSLTADFVRLAFAAAVCTRRELTAGD